MRLEKIVLDGFKSFADKVELTFDSPITAIVGPNGCGKSNVVDAVKWVLGDQSVKSLRSEQMADVIFSGSSSRKPAGSAEVSLFMSNPDGSGSRQLPIDTDQVQITRRIYKSGESEYRINNKICRLKDIRELFMDTGVGVKAYSIIEQGQVGQLLNSSKTERRAIFEEAAGVSKYKAHKKEALRKLEYAEQNLLRLADILSEVQKQLRSIKLQAGKARNYLQYSGRLKELQVNYSLAEYAKNRTQNAEKRTGLGRLEDQLAGVVAEVSKNDTLISELGQRIIETENDLSHAGNCLVAVQSKIEQNLQRIEFLKTRIAELQQRKEDAEKRIEKLQEQKNLFESDLEQYGIELTNGEKMLEEKKLEAEQLQKTIQEIDAECASLDADLEDEKSGVVDIVRRTAQLHNEVQSICIHRSNLSSQKERLSGRAEASRAELEKLFAEKAQHTARMADIDKVLSELQQSLDSKHNQTEETNSLITADSKKLAQKKEERSALNSELSVLTDMEARREGLNNAVKNILQNRDKFGYVQGILAETIAADVEYANAVEASLEGITDALVISSTSVLLADKETIEKLEGRVNFISADRIEPFVDKKDLSGFPQIKGRLAEFVKGESKYAPLVWKLLGKTIVVDSIDSAIELAGKISGDYKFVTLKGEILSAGGAIRLGPLGKAAGLISRKSRLRQLDEMIAAVSTEIAELEGQIEKSTHTNEHLTKLCRELRTAVYEANTEKMQVGSKLAIYEQDIKRLSEEQPLLASEIGLLEAQIAQSVQKEYDSKQKLQELEEVDNQRTKHIEELEARFAEQKAEQQSQTDRFADLRVALGQIAEQIKASKQAIASLQSQIQENQTAAETAQAEIQSCSEQSQQAQRDILESEAMVSELFVEKEKNQQSSSLLQEKVEELLEERNRTEQLLRQRRSEQSEVESAISALKIELSQLEVKAEDLVERVRDELQMDLAAAYENYEQSQVNWDEVKEEITQLRGKIERLGNVNVDAITEQDELEKRNEFLSAQVEDLNKSKAQLQQLIGHLNTKSREKFKETFELIRTHFQQVFRKLFGGGKADIVLEDAEDILEAGIEVIAKLPGKETMGISLLSGGEKALTAIALLFSVFKAKPSPFCFLDEVDAPLDEANNERFNMLLREFQKESQFVVITHSKRTMSVAEVLFGITMQTRGVSKKISVRFDQVDEETAAVA
ncbi:MAG: chromosome segregation protein SMC [Phycisphaerae bacterium]|nr:chromosome segregation protein SMC [Phycisphaerae bacterium]